ncbi:ERI1 exoribonuclease [Seminavis robusta]|uniref:ERI1 exoribonuclease n=1 Tax=Seminavis robusta TaxID=568900 RepID=A0A9N8EML2_9STRA|nr:ERI1 exoribonuclease [Seminavis robusta]|eukprot:Sro1372_g267180.1 ERI1 exoribonuclease (381) ;mRNA; r:17201-18471
MLELEDLPLGLRELVDAAPTTTGKVPTPQEIDAQREFKAKMKARLAALPSHSNGDNLTLGYNAIMKLVKKKQQSKPPPKKKKKKAGCEPSTPKEVNSTSIKVPDQTGRHLERSEHIDYLLVLDFEATCSPNGEADPDPVEIIEFPTLLLNVKTGEIEDTFHYYVKPEVHPELSEFCTSLTGIHQSTVKQGKTLTEVLALHQQWLEQHNLIASSATDNTPATQRLRKQRFLYCTSGDSDLRQYLPQQLKYHNQPVPYHFKSWINIQHPFSKFYHCKSRGMTNILHLLDIELEGRVLLGVVGTSRGGLIDHTVARDALVNALATAESAAMEKDIVIISGGGLVPKLAFQWACAKGYEAVQVASSAVKSTPKGWCDHRFEPWR